MDTPQGPDWRDMNRVLFDKGLLPAKHRNAPEGLFPVTDVVQVKAPKVSPAAEMDGQADLFSEAGQ